MPARSFKLEDKEIMIEMGYNDYKGNLIPISKDKKNKIFLPTIKKCKMTSEILDKIKWGEIDPFVRANNGVEGYLGAYSQIEFFTYKYQQIYKTNPNIFIIENIQTTKFITNLFKLANIPEYSYYKTWTESYGEYSINLIVFAIKVSEKESIYMQIDSDEVTFYYSDLQLETNINSPLYILISLLKGVVEPKIEKNKIYVVYQDKTGFSKTGFNIKKVNVNLSENYNDGFEEISKEIVLGLNSKNKSNLVILRGDPGTGKTMYIRYLAHKLKKNIIFISPDMVNSITDPSFIPFLIKNSDAILIIEDGEPAVGTRGISGRTGAVSNILNLTDGLLSDCLNISIVVTLNTTEKNIDEALLRKGRLLKSYIFEKLSIDKSKQLMEKLGRNPNLCKEPMTLADIYNKEDNNNKIYNTKQIGFGSRE